MKNGVWVDKLEDVESKCTRLMSLENIVGGPNMTIRYTILLFQIAKVINRYSLNLEIYYYSIFYFQSDISNLYISVSLTNLGAISCKLHPVPR